MRPTLVAEISPFSVDKMTRRSPQRKHPPPLPSPALHHNPSVAAGVKDAVVDAATPREVDAEAHPRARPRMR